MSDHHKIIPFTPKGKGDGGKPPMEPFEKRFQAIETDLEVIKATMATKEDLGEIKVGMGQMEARITRWMVGTMLTAAGLAFAIGQFLP